MVIKINKTLAFWQGDHFIRTTLSLLPSLILMFCLTVLQVMIICDPLQQGFVLRNEQLKLQMAYLVENEIS